MRRSISRALSSVCLTGLIGSAGAQQAKTEAIAVTFSGEEKPITQLIVKYKDDTIQTFSVAEGRTKTAKLASKERVAVTYKRQMSGIAHVLSLQQPMSRAEAIALSKRLEMDPNVAFAELDEWVYPSLVPNDPGYLSAAQWHFFAPNTTTGNAGGANLPSAWDVSRGQDVIVAVIDTGVASHPDLAANVLGGYDFIGDVVNANDGDGRDADASDPGNWRSATDCPAPANTQKNSNWHGTHVSGTIAEVTNNAVGLAGVAHEARILPLRTLGRCGGFSSDSADAIRWAVGLPVPGIANNPNTAKVINMSLGSSNACSITTQSAIDAARAAGAVIVAATGNEGMTTIGQPASCIGVIAVTAHTFQGDNASYANVGVGTTISGPGGGSCTTPDNATFTCSTLTSSSSNYPVWSTALRGLMGPTSLSATGTTGPGYFGNVGTSMATPHVSGVAALLLSRMPALTPNEVSFLITSSARPHPAGLYCSTATAGWCGAGLLDGASALARLSDRTPMVTATPSSPITAGGQTTTLTAAASPRNGGSAAFTYSWTQTSGQSVLLTNAATAAPSFTATNPGGTHGFSVTVRDGNGYRVTQTLAVRSNNPATIAAIATASVVQGSSATFNVTATDPENDVLTYVAANLPAGSNFSAASGQFTWSNVTAALGTYTFNVVANDGTVNSAPVTATINVVAAPPAAPATGGGGGGALSLMQLIAFATLFSALTFMRDRRRRVAAETAR